jgi:hypothetical protein
MSNKNIVVGVVVVLAVVFGVAFLKQTSVTVINQAPEQQTQSYGASPGPDRFNDRECINNVCMWNWSSGIRPATSTSITGATFCSYKIQATSTLVAATLSGVANEAYENTFEIGIGTTRIATTTRLGIKTIAASAPFEVIASTTEAVTGFSGNVLIPGTFINFNVATGTPNSTFNPSGKCVVQTREV